MFRSVLISLAKASWAQRLVTNWKFAKRVASRFIAGETLNEAINVVLQLNSRGFIATIDHLGENTASESGAINATDEVIKILEAIQVNKLRANVSVKLSQIGLTVDEEACRNNLKRLLDKAQNDHNFIRIDMEDSGLTQKTVGIYQWARESGYQNVGIVIQSYLFRSEDDIMKLSRYDTRVRLCKGAYKESSSVAFAKKSDVDANYDLLTQLLIRKSQEYGIPKLSLDGKMPPIPAIATHDAIRIKYAIDNAVAANLPKEALEFQMLHGIRRDLQEQLVREGYPVRVYVPFGTHWYPYFMRRLAERPSNLWFFVSNFFRK